MVKEATRHSPGIRTFWHSGWKTSRGIKLLLFFLFLLLFYFSISPRWIQETYDLELNSISEATIEARWKIEDTAATLRARADASQDVQQVYSVITMRNENLVELLFGKLETVNGDNQIGSQDKIAIYKNELPQIYRDFFDSLLLSYRKDYKESLLTEVELRVAENEYRIPEETYFKLPRLSVGELADMENVAKSIAAKLMGDRIADPQAARAKVPELVNASQLTNKNAREVVQEIVRFVLTPNRFYDEEATKEAKIKAEENTEPIFIQKGDVIVSAGERITEEKYALLNEMELLASKASFLPQIGTVMIVFLFMMILYLFIKQTQYPIASNNANLLMLLVIYALTTMGLLLVSLVKQQGYPYIGLLAPVAMGSMLTAILLNAQIAYIASILLGFLSGILLNASDEILIDYRYSLVSIVIGFLSVFALHGAGQRSSILKAGLMVSIFGAMTAVALILVEDSYTAGDLLYAIGFSFVGGIVTAVLVIGLLPFFELAFGILSPLKLVELSNPNHPLLRKLLTETPGTYHHSVMVGNLAEAAAEAIGANGLLCRVGSFYHDIGKTKRPSYFIENQTNIENPHDHIDPSLSKSIIIAHARDGVEMLLASKMPKPIRDIAEQHHGTTLLKYFYHKALKQLEAQGETGETIDEQDYRYPGPKAQSREAAIVGIADGLEASVRSLRNPTPEQIDAMVQKIVKDRLDDGQLAECDLTLKELDTIARAMKETLLGVFHSRIEYE